MGQVFLFGIGRCITINTYFYKVTHVHYLQQKKQRKDMRKNNTIEKERKENDNHFTLLSAAPVNHDQAVQLIFVFNVLLLSTNYMYYIHESV